MLKRHSSRRHRLDRAVLKQRLEGAVSYDRIAGYFRSSLFEMAGEALAGVAGPVRIICNSDLDPQDLATATAAQAALRRSWCAGKPEDAPCRSIVVIRGCGRIRSILPGWCRKGWWCAGCRRH